MLARGINGAIGYVENDVAVNAGAPVASVENSSGHFLAPDAQNVSLSLLRAAVTATGEADLRRVYTDPDARSYPLSSFTSALVTTSRDASMTTAKRQTEVDFFGHAVCNGQSEIDSFGYAALPLNLTRAALTTMKQLRQIDSAVNARALSLSRCGNPTIAHADDGTVSDDLDATVPQPPVCTAEGSGPCPSTSPNQARVATTLDAGR